MVSRPGGRKLAENLDKRTDQISVGFSRFSNSGLKEFEAFAVDGRRTLAELNKAIKNIDQHPTRLLFGRLSRAESSCTMSRTWA